MAAETAKPKRDLARKEAGGNPESLKEVGGAFLPDACIYENEDGLIVLLDVPGVPKGQVQIEADETDTLQIRARNAFEEPAGAIFREWRPGDYYRSFRLGRGFDKEALTAKLEEGVLEVRIPRREERKPRKVEIEA